MNQPTERNPDERRPAERQRDNPKARIARDRPMPPGHTNSRMSDGPFGRGDREPDPEGKAPRNEK